MLPLEVVVETSGNPVWGVLVALLGIAYLALFIGALVSIMKSPNYTTGLKALWVLICFIMPFIGSLVWFIWGKNGNSQSL